MDTSRPVPWIHGPLAKARAMRAFCSEVIDWRRGCGLEGAPARYDQVFGCYGNPDSETVFLAEILSLRGLEVGREAYGKAGVWRSSWKVSDSDLIFRVALHKGGFIPDPMSDEPEAWGCWVTDFVKCGASTKEWERIKKEGGDSEVMTKSARLLKAELDIVRPKRLVFVGDQAEAHFSRHFRPSYDSLPKAKVKHYSFRAKTTEKIEAYYREFERLRDRIKEGKLG